MPSLAAHKPPPEPMTWRRAMPVIAVGIIFDALRLMFESFIVTAPAIGAALCTYLVSSDNTFATALGGTSCAVGATAVGIAAAPAIASIGVVMAEATGFAGWLTVGGILLKTNARIFRENTWWFVSSLLFSEIPFVGAVPAITIILVKMYRTQIRKESADRQRYKAAKAAEEKRRRETFAAQAANDLYAQSEPEDANDPTYSERLTA